MRRPRLSLLALVVSLALGSWAHADDVQDYAVLIISRERLEVATPCEIGVYLQDELVGRLFQDDVKSFNLPAGKVSVRLTTLPGRAYGCNPGIEEPTSLILDLKAGQISKYRIATGQHGMYLKPAALNY